MDPGVADLLRLIREEASAKKQAARSFAEAVLHGDETAMRVAGWALEMQGAWKDAMRVVARGIGAGAAQRLAFTPIWAEHGSHIRTEVGDDLLVIAALRNLLPAYEGPSLTLFRGDSWTNRCRRTYGLSWTSDRQVADDFARSRRTDYQDGSCLVSAEVSSDAIVSAVHLVTNDYAEDEYVVDRRRLSAVRVVERYPRDTDVLGGSS